MRIKVNGDRPMAFGDGNNVRDVKDGEIVHFPDAGAQSMIDAGHAVKMSDEDVTGPKETKDDKKADAQDETKDEAKA